MNSWRHDILFGHPAHEWEVIRPPFTKESWFQFKLKKYQEEKDILSSEYDVKPDPGNPYYDALLDLFGSLTWEHNVEMKVINAYLRGHRTNDLHNEMKLICHQLIQYKNNQQCYIPPFFQQLIEMP